MLHLITNTKLNKEYKKNFFKYLKKNHPKRREVFLSIDGKMEVKKVNYKPISKNSPLMPDKNALWFSKVSGDTCYFGLGRDGPLRYAKKHETPLLKGKLITKINYNNIAKSNLIFAKEDKNGKIYLLLKINLDKLNKREKIILREKNHIINIFNEKTQKKNTYLNLGNLNNPYTLKNLYNFIANTKTKNNPKSNIIEVLYVNIPKNHIFKNNGRTDKAMKKMDNNKIIEDTNKRKIGEDDIMDEKQEIIIKELKEGKSIKEAAKTAETLEIIVNRWIKLGKEGDDRYSQFYNEYIEIMGIEEEKEEKVKKEEELPTTRSTTIENKELVEKAIGLLNENKTIEEINKILDLPEYRIKNWCTQGKLGIKPFDEFYKLVEESKGNEIEAPIPKEQKEKENVLNELTLKELDYILEDNKFFEMVPNKDVKIKTILTNINDNEIKKSIEKLNKLKLKQSEIAIFLEEFNTDLLLSFLNKYDRVLYKNKSRDQIIDRIIKELKFKDTEEFYNEMTKLPDEEKIAKEEREEIEKTIREKELIIEEKKVKKCIICGKKLKNYTTKDKCKSCSRSIHAANILNTLLKNIGPEVPFYKEDLEKLGFSNIKIQDVIWTLQENDLINKESSKKYSLKNEKILNEFLEEWKEYIEEVEETEGLKLSKTCTICKKELPINKFAPSNVNKDGYEDYCKDCARPIQTAIGLKQLLNYITPGTEFKKEDLYEHYQETFILDAEIFSLQEYDLIEYDPENNNYTLKNQEKLDKFLDKYLIEFKEEEEAEEEGEESTPIETEAPGITYIDYTENELINRKMNEFLNELKITKDKDEAIKNVNLTKTLLKSWLRFGRQGLQDFTKFYEDYKNIINSINKESEPQQDLEGDEHTEIETTTGQEADGEEEKGLPDSTEDNKEYEFGYSFEIHEKLIEEIKNGKTDNEAFKIIGVTRYQVDKWHEKGLNGEEPYNQFHKDYLNAKIYAKNNNEYYKKENKIRRKNFIGHIKKGKPMRVACEYSGLEFETVQNWINMGNKGESPYKEFYKEYILAKGSENVEETTTYDEDKSNIKVIVFEELDEYCEIMIKGKVENDDLIKSIDKLYNYLNDIQKIITNRINIKESEVLIILKTQKNNIETIKKIFE